MRLNHVHLASEDIPTMVAFYQEHFGFREFRKLKQTTVLVNREGFLLAIDEHELSSVIPKECHLGFTLETRDSVETLYQRMRGDGVPLASELLAPSENALHFYCLDPNGNRIEVGWYSWMSL